MTALAPLALGLAIACALAALIAGPGYRFGAWPLGMGFMLLRWAAYGAIGVALVAIAGAIASQRQRRRGRVAVGIVAFVIAAATFGVPALMLVRANRLPNIHDITTDPDDPPRFVAVLSARVDARNSAEYGGPDVAAAQRRAYPDVVPLTIDAPVDVAFRRALSAARAMHWTIVAEVPDEGRIEATDTTALFGFKDDIVVRVRSAGNGSRVDVRSVSRIGSSDVGTNARRIEAYLDRLRAQR